MNLGCRIQDQLNTSEPTAPYIIGRELILRKLPGQQWESNSQPSQQLRLMSINTSASTETATTAYIYIYIYMYIYIYIYDKIQINLDSLHMEPQSSNQN